MTHRKSALHTLEESILRTISGLLETAAHFNIGSRAYSAGEGKTTRAPKKNQAHGAGEGGTRAALPGGGATRAPKIDHQFVSAVEPIADWLFTDYWRVQTLGAKNIPAKGRALVVANHSGTLPFDGAMLHLAVRRHHPKKRFVRFLVDDFVYRLDIMGEVMHRLGGVRASPDNAKALLKRGNLVAVFPEGVKGLGKLYSERYRLARFGRGGFVRVAAENETPIIPCAIVGAEEIYPILWKSDLLAKSFNVPYLPVTPTFPWLGALGLIPLPSQWVIAFGKPIHIPKTVLNDPLKIHEWSLSVRDVIRKMLVMLLKERRSIWKF